MGDKTSKLLILTPDSHWAQSALTHLHKSFEGEFYTSGKEGQLALYRKQFSYVLIDLKIVNNSALEVIRFIHQKNSSIRIFVMTDQKTWDEGAWDKQKLSKLGVVDIFQDLKPQDINTPIKSVGLIKKWEDIEEKVAEAADDTEKSILDSKFTRIKIEELFEDTKAIFDYYIRIGANRYVKVVNKGEKTSGEQFRKYSSGGAQYLYFLAEERADFIGYQNEVISKKIATGSVESAKILKSIRSVSDKYIEEIHTNGLQPYLIEEGKALCDNVHQFTKKDKNLTKLLSQLEEFNPAAYSHSFLVCFFTNIISKNLDWIGDRTREALALGAMIHDIGLIHIPHEIVNKSSEEMSAYEKAIFELHPEKGREAVASIPSVTRSIVEIIMQHHEASDGSGYPLSLTGHRIFPMAKIVGLADSYSNYIVEKEVSPLDGLKEFLNCRDNLTRFEPDLVRNLIKGFIPEKKS